MHDVQLIDLALLEQVTAQAQSSPRRRRNFNFHVSEAEPCHRLLNAIEPGSYIQPHCHNDAMKDETLLIVRGRVGVVFFDAHGAITSQAVLEPGGAAVGVNIPHGVFHTLVGLVPGSVFFEAKAGPYAPLTAREKAPWAPAEGDPRAAAFLARLQQLFT
jgi:cupin fold WbuC family metalloprotein